MNAAEIVVRWAGGSEVVFVDLKALHRGGQILTTTESCPSIPSYPYVTRSKFVPDNKGGGELTVHYRKGDNHALSKTVCRWGHAIYDLNEKLDEGNVEWVDDDDDSWNGRVRWKRFSKKETLLSKSERKSVEVWARKQAKFRKRLLMIDPQCALTGEREPRLLEAAHVISKANRGNEVDANGIMLRIDLHRLYDAKFFRFRKDGSVELGKLPLSKEYGRILRGASISTTTFSRIRRAWSLAKRNG